MTIQLNEHVKSIIEIKEVEKSIINEAFMTMLNIEKIKNHISRLNGKKIKLEIDLKTSQNRLNKTIENPFVAIKHVKEIKEIENNIKNVNDNKTKLEIDLKTSQTRLNNILNDYINDNKQEL